MGGGGHEREKRGLLRFVNQKSNLVKLLIFDQINKT